MANPYMNQNQSAPSNPYIKSNPYMQEQKKTWDDLTAEALSSVAETLSQPAAAALEVINWFDKPRGAIAGAVKAYQDNSDIVEGAKKGFQENTSWKETFNQDWVKENPTTAAIAGFAADVVADPLNVLTPVKLVKGASQVAKTAGLTEKINPYIKMAKQSEIGQKAIAAAEDFTGVNRLENLQDDFRAARASDQVRGQDVVDEIAGFKKESPDYAPKITEYVEAAERPQNTANRTNLRLEDDGASQYLTALEKQKEDMINESLDVFKANPGGKGVTQGGVMKDAEGNVVGRFGRQSNNPQWYQDFWQEYGHAPTKSTLREFVEKDLSRHDESGFADLVDEIESVKTHLSSANIEDKTPAILRDVQKKRASKMINQGLYTREDAFDALRNSGEEIPDYLLQEHQRVAKAAKQEIPYYIYRDQILSSVPDEPIRKAIQTIGDKVIEFNKKNQDVLTQSGRLGDDALTRFSDGSHLRRSFSQYESPEKFLEALKKNGTQEEWARAYGNYIESNAPGRQGFGKKHSVDTSDFAQRQVLSDETLKKLGVINDPEYKVMDTLNRASKTIREDDFLTRVNSMFGVDAEQGKMLSYSLPDRRKYVPIPKESAYGSLAGRWLPKDVANQVMGTIGTKPDNINKSLQKVVSWWKVGKLVNPSSIFRNFYSGLPMATTFGNVPVSSIPKQLGKLYTAMRNGGKNSPLIRQMREAGLFADMPWERQDLKGILGERNTGIKWVAEKGMEAFGAPDNFWRAVVFSHHIDQGKSVKEAAKIARTALLDYANSPEWVNWASKTGLVPFIKFPYHATKQTAKALYNNPASVTRWTKPQNQVNTEDREKILPDYMKARTLLPLGKDTRMVNGKPQPVQANLDLSYILPFASDLSMGNPLMDAIQLQRTGRNGIGQQVIHPGMNDKEKTQAWAKYLSNSAAPALLSPYTAEKLYNGVKGNVDSKGRQYNLGEAVAQVGFGLKNVPINTDEQFKQKMGIIQRQQNDVKALLGQISRDKSISQQQKQEMIRSHVSQLKELAKMAKESQEAYKRLKKKEGN